MIRWFTFFSGSIRIRTVPPNHAISFKVATRVCILMSTTSRQLEDRHDWESMAGMVSPAHFHDHITHYCTRLIPLSNELYCFVTHWYHQLRSSKPRKLARACRSPCTQHYKTCRWRWGPVLNSRSSMDRSFSAWGLNLNFAYTIDVPTRVVWVWLAWLRPTFFCPCTGESLFREAGSYELADVPLLFVLLCSLVKYNVY